MKNFILIITTILFSNYLFAQENSHSEKLPWVKNIMPKFKNTTSQYQTIFIESSNLDDALVKNENKLISTISAKRGQHFSSEQIIRYKKIHRLNQLTINNSKKYNKKDIINKDIERTIKIKGSDFEMSYIPIDHYYEYKNGTYHLWVLYLVAEDGKKLGNVPAFAYKVNNGAWRSLLVPGWAQFYTKQPVKGSLFLAGEAALIGGGFYLYNRFQHNDTRAKEATSVKIEQEYRKRAKNYKTYSYITFGAAAGLYIYNVVDAFTSKRGKMIYDYKNMRLAVTPSVGLTDDYYVTAGFTINF